MKEATTRSDYFFEAGRKQLSRGKIVYAMSLQPMRIIQAVLFDVIGTTVLEGDPECINRCFVNAFSENSVTITKNDVLLVRGRDKREAIQQLLLQSGHSIGMTDQILETFKSNVTAEISTFIEHPGLAMLVSHLKNKNIKVGIGSGLPVQVFELLFAYLNWDRYAFDYIGLFENFKAGRPDPIMIHDMASRLRVPVQTILKVGDTISDIHEGKNAKAITAVVMAGTQKRELLLASQPDYIFESLLDLITVIEQVGEH